MNANHEEEEETINCWTNKKNKTQNIRWRRTSPIHTFICTINSLKSTNCSVSLPIQMNKIQWKTQIKFIKIDSGLVGGVSKESMWVRSPLLFFKYFELDFTGLSCLAHFQLFLTRSPNIVLSDIQNHLSTKHIVARERNSRGFFPNVFLAKHKMFKNDRIVFVFFSRTWAVRIDLFFSFLYKKSAVSELNSVQCTRVHFVHMMCSTQCSFNDCWLPTWTKAYTNFHYFAFTTTIS